MTARSGLIVCAVLLALFATVSYSAVLTKSATYDEPVQAMAGWLRLHHHDFRFNYEDPPLWEDWAALPNGTGALKPDFTDAQWTRMPANQALEWPFAEKSLFHTPGVDGAAFVNRSRAMMLIVGLLLGALVVLWSWRLAGPIAAVLSLILFAFDPGLLAHASLVKNDVAMGLVLLGIAFLVWRMGQEVRLPHAIGFVLACGAAAIVKFSAILVGPIVLLLLGIRALAPAPWRVLGRELQSRAEKIGAVVALIACASCVIYGSIWAAYDFRFRATPDPQVQLDSDAVVRMLSVMQTGARLGDMSKVTKKDVKDWKPDLPTQALLGALHKRLLPEAWIDGFLFIYASSLLRTSFLFNQSREIGWWYYFPVAVAVKTPIATLLAIVAGAAAGIWFFRRKQRAFDDWWTLACLVIPPAIYFGSAMRAHMNIGVRHVIPVYGFAFVGCGVVGAAALREWGRPVAYRIGGVAVALAIETFAAAPNFISFFNLAAGGYQNGINILGDSNLDWGQDLPLLAEWQSKHHDVHLYLSYFGTVNPSFYGIKARALPGNYPNITVPEPQSIRFPAVFAISANHLQGFSVGVEVGDQYAKFRTRKPREILGGTIYLYDVRDQETLAALQSRDASTSSDVADPGDDDHR